jgi:hypothetical protein
MFKSIDSSILEERLTIFSHQDGRLLGLSQSELARVKRLLNGEHYAGAKDSYVALGCELIVDNEKRLVKLDDTQIEIQIKALNEINLGLFSNW